jgi:MipA family protein
MTGKSWCAHAMIREFAAAWPLGAALAVLSLTQSASAQTAPVPIASAPTSEVKPLFEVGAIAAGGTFPDYPASGQNHFAAVPLPYLIYRGDYLQLAANSIRGILFTSERVSLSISAAGGLPTHDDAAREGMPALDYTGQIGPRLDILLGHDVTNGKIELQVPLRAVASTDFKSAAYRGLVLSPELAYTHLNFLGSSGTLRVWIGPEFATARLMDYYYTVEPQYVVPGRSQYSAHGGYLGSHVEITYRYPITERSSFLAYTGPTLYTGATNAGSPLFKKQYGLSAAVAFSYSFYESDATTDVQIDE